MKKIVGTILAIALVASSAFAEVNVGMGFSRGIFTPIAYNGNDAMVDISTSWGPQPRIGASISASSDDCGVVADIKFDGGNVAVNDNAYIWCKPFSWLKFTIGQTFDDTLRGNACFGSFDWLRYDGMAGEDVIFTRVCGNPLEGAYLPLVGTIVMLDPIEGLHVSVGVPVVGYNPDKDNGRSAAGPLNPTGGNDNYTADTWENAITHLQIQAGYTIANIGTIRAQWIGAGKDTEDKLQGQIQAAFLLKAIEGMTLDVGAKFNTTEGSDIGVSAFWSMGFGTITANALVALGIPTDDANDLSMEAGAGVSVDLGNGLGVDADVRFKRTFTDGADSQIGFGVFLNKGIANGGVGVGFQGASHWSIRDFGADDFTFAIPVRVQCFF